MYHVLLLLDIVVISTWLLDKFMSSFCHFDEHKCIFAGAVEIVVSVKLPAVM